MDLEEVVMEKFGSDFKLEHSPLYTEEEINQFRNLFLGENKREEEVKRSI